jgi:CRISPR-associated exonuclease Cas4
MKGFPCARLTATELLEYAYCPRFVYYENCLEIPEHQEQHFKVQKGREVHEEKQGRNLSYLRKKLGCTGREIAPVLFGQNGLWRGHPDEVLFLEDGTAAPLDYKWSEWKGRVFLSYRLQLTYYAVLIEETWDMSVAKGALIYVRSKNKLVEQPLGKKERGELEEAVEAIVRIRDEGWFPQGTTRRSSCRQCCYQKLCPQ